MLLLWSSGLDLPVVLFLVFFLIYILAFWDVFGCDVGHLKALALIPIDVYVGGK